MTFLFFALAGLVLATGAVVGWLGWADTRRHLEAIRAALDEAEEAAETQLRRAQRAETRLAAVEESLRAAYWSVEMVSKALMRLDPAPAKKAAPAKKTAAKTAAKKQVAS